MLNYRRLLTAFFCSTLAACSGDSPQLSIEVAVDGLFSAALSADSNHAVIGSIAHGGSWWQLDPKERLFDWNHDSESLTNISATAISPDGRYAMTADATTMVLWDTDTGENLTYFKTPAEILDISISNNTELGVLAALALDNYSAVIFNASRGRVIAEFNHKGRVRSVDISADGRWLISGGDDFKAVFWSVAVQKEVSHMQHKDDVRVVELSSDNQLALSVSKYDKALVWRTQDGTIIGEVPNSGDAMRRGRTFASGEFSSDNALLVTGSSDRIVELWRIEGMQALGRWEMPLRSSWKPTGAAVLAVGFDKNNQVVAAAANGFIHQMQP